MEKAFPLNRFKRQYKKQFCPLWNSGWTSMLLDFSPPLIKNFAIEIIESKASDFVSNQLATERTAFLETESLAPMRYPAPVPAPWTGAVHTLGAAEGPYKQPGSSEKTLSTLERGSSALLCVQHHLHIPPQLHSPLQLFNWLLVCPRCSPQATTTLHCASVSSSS